MHKRIVLTNQNGDPDDALTIVFTDEGIGADLMDGDDEIPFAAFERYDTLKTGMPVWIDPALIRMCRIHASVRQIFDKHGDMIERADLSRLECELVDEMWGRPFDRYHINDWDDANNELSWDLYDLVGGQ